MDNSRADSVVRMYLSDDTIQSVSELAVRNRMNVGLVYHILRKAGYTTIAVDNRYYNSAILKMLGINSPREAPKCVDCQIIVLDDGQEVPPGWNISISGRIGDLCASCYSELCEDGQQRFADMYSIGCILCGEKPEIHNIRKNNEYRDYKKTIPLCPLHHKTGGVGVAIHAGKIEWEDNFGTEAFLLSVTNKLLKGV